LRPPPGRPPALHPHEPRRALGAARGPDAGGAARGIVRRQFFPGGRIEGHLGPEGARLISRVADHCFWFGRYLERAESTARVLAVTTNLALDGELDPEQCWLPVVIVSGEREHFLERHGGGAVDWNEAVPRYMTWDEDNLTCLVRSVGAARENARSIREVLS